MQHPVDHRLHIRMLNLSFGTNSVQRDTLDPLIHAVDVAWRAGIVVVAAAGSYLRRFPIDILKMDKTLVQGVGTTAGDDALAQAIIDLTHTLRLVVVAEGIERVEQRDELRRLNCNLGQGFFFTHPLDPDEIERMLITDPREPAPV